MILSLESVKFDDERVGMLPTRLAFVEMSKFHKQGSKLLFWASSQIRHHNSTHFPFQQDFKRQAQAFIASAVEWCVLTSFAVF
jgi:hypothetical protein